LFRDRADELGITGAQYGIVYFDEMKLKSGFYSNFKDGRTTAMAASTGEKTLCLAEELLRLIEQEDEAADGKSVEVGAAERFTDAVKVNMF